MADKKRIRHNIKQLQRVKTWQLVILLILVGFVSAAFLRLNNIGMVERRSAVMTADEIGDNDIIKERLSELQHYVNSHMNTDMGKGLWLESTYNRAVLAAYSAASVDGNSNGNVYKKVQDICKPRFSGWSYAYIQCTVDELAKFPAGASLVSSVKKPDLNLYIHSFASPLWSPDFAGFSVLIFVVILIMIFSRLTGVIILRIMLRRHYKSI